MKSDWYKIAVVTGSIDPAKPDFESGGDSYAKIALEETLGEEWINDTVEHAISGKKGAELAMNCLRLLNSEKACLYAYHVYKESNGERARMAVWLIKHIAHPVSYNWVEEFLNDKNVMTWGLGVLDQLLWCEKIEHDENVERLLNMAKHNSHNSLDELVEFIRDYIKKRTSED